MPQKGFYPPATNKNSIISRKFDTFGFWEESIRVRFPLIREEAPAGWQQEMMISGPALSLCGRNKTLVAGFCQVLRVFAQMKEIAADDKAN
jgi:hypothetical protein